MCVIPINWEAILLCVCKILNTISILSCYDLGVIPFMCPQIYQMVYLNSHAVVHSEARIFYSFM